MKVYSLYYKDTFVVAYPNREDVVDYGKIHYSDPWDCNIVEEYLSKSPYNMFPGSPYTPLTNPNPIPYTIPPVISKPPATYPDTYPHIYCDGTK
jgi:hypothetical protein